jgi:hypothetical protein
MVHDASRTLAVVRKNYMLRKIVINSVTNGFIYFYPRIITFSTLKTLGILY